MWGCEERSNLHLSTLTQNSLMNATCSLSVDSSDCNRRATWSSGFPSPPPLKVAKELSHSITISSFRLLSRSARMKWVHCDSMSEVGESWLEVRSWRELTRCPKLERVDLKRVDSMSEVGESWLEESWLDVRSWRELTWSPKLERVDSTLWVRFSTF